MEVAILSFLGLPVFYFSISQKSVRDRKAGITNLKKKIQVCISEERPPSVEQSGVAR